MTTTDLLQFSGTIMLMAMVAWSARLVTGHWWCRYGKEAFMVWIFLGAGLAGLRIADNPFDLVNAEQTRTIAGGLYLTCFLAMVDMSMAHIIWHRRVEASHQRGMKGRT